MERGNESTILEPQGDHLAPPLTCLGHYGYGTGFYILEGMHFCLQCPKGEECWRVLQEKTGAAAAALLSHNILQGVRDAEAIVQ